jgi:hypothetical protein
MTEFYESTSKGLVAIATMEYKWLVNSLNILVTRQPHRTDEIEAMTAEVAKRDAEYAAQQAAEASRVNNFETLDNFLTEEGILDGVTERAQARVDATRPDYAKGDEVELFDPNPRAAIGGNEPPEETPFEADEVFAAVDVSEGPALPNVADYWSSLEISLRNTGPLVDLGKVKISAAAITAVTDDASAQTAGEVVKELRRVRQVGEDAFTAEKAPILAATKVCDEFGRPFKALTTEQTRIERLIGTHQAKVAEDRRKALAEAAAAERKKAQDLLDAAAAQETAGHDVVGDILMDHAEKAETFAAIHETRASAPVADLAKTQTSTVALGVRAPWTADLLDVAALRETCGILGQHIPASALLTAAQAYVRASVVNGKFTGKELPGVRIYQDVRGVAR